MSVRESARRMESGGHCLVWGLYCPSLSFPEGKEVEEGGFLPMLYLPGSCCLEGLEMQGIVGQVVPPTVPSGPSLLVFAFV